MALSTTAQNRTVWGIRILLALAFGAAGVAKLAGAPMMVANFEAIGFGQWFRYVTGVVELIGVVLILMPRTGFFGGLWLGGTMVGAVASHLFLTGGSSIPAMVLGALSATVAYSLRPTNLTRSFA
ncbi:MAG: DoxX family protein [Pseudomonadota bacterium]